MTILGGMVMWKSLRELADLVGGEIAGDQDVRITGVADLADAKDGDIVFAEAPRYLEEAERSSAAALIAFEGARDSIKPMIKVANPRYAFANVLRAFSPVRRREEGVHASALISLGTTLGKTPSVGFNTYIGENTTIGDNAWIYPNVYIGDNVTIGDNCVIYPFVSIQDDVTIGNSVTIHGGSVIGSDGFGYINVDGQQFKMPQIGSVLIGDDVEIGANCTIDRARTGKTEIGRGTKIDNLVHIAHNVTVGEACIIVAQVGVSGSVTLGDRIVMAGQAGAKDHVSIGSDAIICARSGIIGDIPAGEFVSGYPARPHREQMRMLAAQQKIPNLLKQVKDMEKRIKELEGRLGD